MLKLTKETLAELTPGDLAGVVGGQAEYAVSGLNACLTLVIHVPGGDESCFAASCITN
jgi:hypothetical protein